MVRRWLFNIAMLVSLLMSLSLTVLWIRSHWRLDGFYCTRITHNGTGAAIVYGLNFNKGVIGVIYESISSALGQTAGFAWNSREAVKRPAATTLQRLGFIHVDSAYNFRNLTITNRFDAAPVWLVVSVFMIAPIVWLRRFLRRTTLNNACRKCGYNLTANVSGVCPECGTPVIATKK